MIVTDGQARRYRALRSRAIDQAGTPEGSLCADMADRMLEANPSLGDAESESEPEYAKEYRWHDEVEQKLLIRVGLFLGLEPNIWAKSRKRVIVYISDDAGHAAISHAFDVLLPRLRSMLEATFIGFVSGCLPLADVAKWSPGADVMAATDAAYRAGQASSVRKAIGSGRLGLSRGRA